MKTIFTYEETEVKAILLAALDAAGFEPEWKTADEAKVTRKPPQEPPEAAWIEVDGHKWATDGACLIRDDCPRPLPLRSEPWIDGTARHKPSPDGIRKLLATPAGTVTESAWFQPRMAPILEVGTVIRLGDRLTPVRVERGGETIAMISPVNHYCSGPCEHVEVKP